MIPKKITTKHEEVYSLTDYKIEDENTHHGGGKKEHRNDEEDDDEEGNMGGGRQVRCAHQ